MSVEVEIRGPLSERKYLSLLGFLKRRGKLLKEADQLAIFFQVKKDNLSLKKDHAEEKLVLKFGDWQKGSRREIEVFLKKGQFEQALELFKGLGFTQGHRVPAFRQDFLYQGVQISLKTKAIIGPHFEMEVAVDDRGGVERERRKLSKLARRLKLKVWTEAEYREHTRGRWAAHHPGPEDL